MSNPTTEVVQGLASGIAGSILIALGISWPLVIWAVCGSIIGLSWAPETGRIRAFALFVASSLLSAKGGMVAALLWWDGSYDVAGIAAALCGCVFHPALSAFVTAVPAFISRKVS
jgi:hypothetical protein